MRLRDQILSSGETVSDFAWAAEQRFFDAEALLLESRYTGAVYLLGLGSEMWLKLACFRLLGAGPADLVSSYLGPAKIWMSTAAPGVKPESYHSLMFWAEYLIRWRGSKGKDLPSRLVGELRHHVNNRLFGDWKIDMRYRNLTVSDQHAWRVYNDAWWVRANWQDMWR